VLGDKPFAYDFKRHIVMSMRRGRDWHIRSPFKNRSIEVGAVYAPARLAVQEGAFSWAERPHPPTHLFHHA